MAEAKNGTPSMTEARKRQSAATTAAPKQDSESAEEARLGILQAVERKEISIEEALRLLREMDE